MTVLSGLKQKFVFLYLHIVISPCPDIIERFFGPKFPELRVSGSRQEFLFIAQYETNRLSLNRSQLEDIDVGMSVLGSQGD